MSDAPDGTSDEATSDESLDDLTFEQLYDRIEAVTAQLEGGGLSLEQSVALFEEGMVLAQRGQQLLGDVEQRIEALRQSFEDEASS